MEFEINYKTRREEEAETKRYIREVNAISGRFARVSQDPFVVGLLGNAWAEDLTETQVNYIRGFYAPTEKGEYTTHKILKEFPPEKFTTWPSHYKFNNFIMFER